MPRVGVVSDGRTGETFTSALAENAGWKVLWMDPLRAVDTAVRETPDLLVLSVQPFEARALPLLVELRRVTIAPILMLSERHSEGDTVRALHCGADDCLPQDVSLVLLAARLHAWLRRLHLTGLLQPEEALLGAARLELRPDDLAVRCDDQEVRLSPTEFRLFKTMTAHPNVVLSTEFLLNRVWAGADYYEPDVLRVTLHRLRHKLAGLEGAPVRIDSVPGVGYRLMI